MNHPLSVGYEPPVAAAGAEAAVALSVVMPGLDEAQTLAVCIEKARRSLGGLNCSGEIIVADNGRTDGSQQIAPSLGARVVHVEDKGYGSALTRGTVAARGSYVIVGDPDDGYDFVNLGPFVEKLREGYELPMGNRVIIPMVAALLLGRQIIFSGCFVSVLRRRR